MTTATPNIVMIEPDRLKVDPETQRRFDPAHANRLARGWDESLVGLLQVSMRDDGPYVMDGQHRSAAAKIAGLGAVPLPCYVVEGITLAQEAARFVGVNDGAKRPQALDLFRIRVKSDDLIAVDINRIVTEAGLQIGWQDQDGWVSAVSALEAVYTGRAAKGAKRGLAKPNPQLLADVVMVIHGAWGKNRDAYSATLVRAMGLLLDRHTGQVDFGRLIDRLGKSGTATQILGRARGLAEIKRQSQWTAACDTMVDIYNRNLRTQRLKEEKK